MKTSATALVVCVLELLLRGPARAADPLWVNPSGKPYRWPGTSLRYHVDLGSLGVLDNAAAEMNRKIDHIEPASAVPVVNRVGTEHILFALLAEADSEAVQTLLALEVDLDELRQTLSNPLTRVAAHETAIRLAGT